ncbi:ThiF family adenylyltransferase [Paenibacillus alginolyticus]|uniref:HesA/MoeB/ThiF family protein n=1 Tax=Bacillales TaxID=1385 RepID=UPI0004015D39|nr:ThiF family adenylyltransferase [Paenibacillus alginolyticus]MCY9666462.1 ThiF family adenylyltransferase [Paenibacillus alginolyticus]
MKYTMTFTEKDYTKLFRHLFHDDTVEQAAIVYCKKSKTDSETRLLVKEIRPIDPSEVLEQTRLNIRVPVEVYATGFQKAAKENYCFFWVHTHPGGWLEYSEVDDREEPELFRPAYVRAPGQVHGSLLMNSPDGITGRVWLQDGVGGVYAQPLDAIRVIGTQYRFFFPVTQSYLDLSAFDRNVRAFGKAMQLLLRNLHVGVVGASGTGSPMIEQLARLGVGSISIYDDDTLSATNLTRIHGSSQKQIGLPKVEIMGDMIEEIGFGTKVHRYTNRINQEEIAKTLRDCDVIFGCTDDQLGRSILSDIALRYYIPLFDMGTKIESNNQVLESIMSRLTIVQPGSACLLCLGVVNSQDIMLESKTLKERESLAREGYAPELPEADPAVIAYTTFIASLAAAEFINKLTGMSRGQELTGILYNFGNHAVRTLSSSKNRNCKCGQTDVLGSGDTPMFLEMVW